MTITLDRYGHLIAGNDVEPSRHLRRVPDPSRRPGTRREALPRFARATPPIAVQTATRRADLCWRQRGDL